MCAEALAGGSWKVAPPGECQEPKCVDKVCKIANKPSGDACSADSQTCTQDVCDGQGTCSHTQLTPGTCLIAGACIAAGDTNPGNVCLACDPSSSSSDWSNAKLGAPCKADDLTCTLDECDGKGKCSTGKLKTGTCLLNDAKGTPTCVADGAAVDSAKPCEVCDAANPTVVKSLPDGAPCKGDMPCKVGTCSAGQCDKIGVDSDSCLIDLVGCVASGAPSPSNLCLQCEPKTSQTQWSPRAAGSKCDSDSVPCTSETCDGAGSCGKVAENAACSDKAGPCTAGECDANIGCVAVAKGVTATCEGDGQPCTVESCDGQGGCGKEGKAKDELCDDKIACTIDKCDSIKGCQFLPQDDKCVDGNACTADSCDAKTGCVNSNLTDGTACSADQLECTTDTCSAGTCKANLKADFCAIGAKCHAAGALANGGCQSCKPQQSQFAWTASADGSACTDDGIACSTDTCASGTCTHAPQASACSDGVACTADLCDLAKGCLNPDACPWGHACNATAGACLTASAVQITASSASEPNPTNPLLFRHELQGGGQRTWVAWQSDSCMSVEGGAWAVKKPARLLAMPLDPQLVPAAQKVKPQAFTLPVSSYFGASTGVCQAFPQFAADPLVPTQGWLAWLEADPSQSDVTKACLGNGGQGGVMRLARLDGKSAAGKVDVAGDVCTYKEGTPPLFLTAGVAVLDGGANDLMNVNQRGILSVRPNGTSLKIWSTSLALKAKAIGDSTAASDTLIGNFVQVRPVVVDFGTKAPTAERYLALAVTAKANVPALWATPISSTGEDGNAVAWTSDKTFGDVFAGASAVCSLDAMVNPAGTLGIVVVLRKTGQDQVVLLTRDAAGALKAEQLVGKTSKGDCRVGVAGARIGWAESNWMPIVFESALATVAQQGTAKYAWANTLQEIPLPQGLVAATLDNAGKDGPTLPLAWRGLTRPTLSGAAMTVAIEAADDTAQSIHVWSWAP